MKYIYKLKYSFEANDDIKAKEIINSYEREGYMELENEVLVKEVSSENILKRNIQKVKCEKECSNLNCSHNGIHEKTIKCEQHKNLCYFKNCKCVEVKDETY